MTYVFGPNPDFRVGIKSRDVCLRISLAWERRRALGEEYKITDGRRQSCISATTMSWNPSSVSADALSGKVAIVTGGNTGIGFETVRQLAIHGCKVVYMASRTESRALEAIERLRTEEQVIKREDNVKYLKLDLTDSRECVEAAKQVLKMEDRLDILGKSCRFLKPPR